jgi:hypothetical protein
MAEGGGSFPFALGIVLGVCLVEAEDDCTGLQVNRTANQAGPSKHEKVYGLFIDQI